MASAIDKILDGIKKFDAENATMGEGELDQGFPGVSSSHAQCGKNYKESMHALIAIWKSKVAELKAAKDPNPEYHAAQQIQIPFMNAQSEFIRCMRMPLHKIKTPAPGDRF